MIQAKLVATGFEPVIKRMRKCRFENGVNLAVPSLKILFLIAQHAPAGKTESPPFAIEVIFRIHMLQQFFGLCDPVIEEALHDIPLIGAFAKLDAKLRIPSISLKKLFILPNSGYTTLIKLDNEVTFIECRQPMCNNQYC